MINIIAYIDPGLGLMAWQALVALFLGLLFYLKKTRNWLIALPVRLFRLGKRDEAAPKAAPARVEEVIRD